jgi:hypothetical protein
MSGTAGEPHDTMGITQLHVTSRLRTYKKKATRNGLLLERPRELGNLRLRPRRTQPTTNSADVEYLTPYHNTLITGLEIPSIGPGTRDMNIGYLKLPAQ